MDDKQLQELARLRDQQARMARAGQEWASIMDSPRNAPNEALAQSIFGALRQAHGLPDPEAPAAPDEDESE